MMKYKCYLHSWGQEDMIWKLSGRYDKLQKRSKAKMTHESRLPEEESRLPDMRVDSQDVRVDSWNFQKAPKDSNLNQGFEKSNLEATL